MPWIGSRKSSDFCWPPKPAGLRNREVEKDWVAVKEVKSSYHNRDIYIYICIYVNIVNNMVSGV